VKILHTESSNGWGGQEIRILKEAIGLRLRGHEVVFAVVRGGKLVKHARKEGFTVYEIDCRRFAALPTLLQLCQIIRRHHIEVINTHSSWDAWMGGIAARLMGRSVVRTRHLSTPVKGGLNGRLLYHHLADFVVTTSSAIISHLATQAKLPLTRFKCVPTGVAPFSVPPEEAMAFRVKWGIKPTDILVGTVCVVRSWKGIQDLIAAAKMLRHLSHIKWVIVGGGYIDQYRHLVDSSLPVIFTEHLDNPFPAIAALDIFTLLSTAHEGISQASLQAAFLKKPLITTSIGGLPEVCLHGVTGIVVPPGSPEKVAEAVMQLADNKELMKKYGAEARQLVEEKFMLHHTLDAMEVVFNALD
jgi:glycosyltransferase involved in cell wall biosynthesis